MSNKVNNGNSTNIGTPNDRLDNEKSRDLLKSQLTIQATTCDGPRVGVLAYCTDLDGPFGAQNTVNTLLADGRFSSVTLIDGDIVLPNAQFLIDNFDAVIAMTDNRCGIPIPDSIANAAADALTGFANTGCGVVLTAFGFSHLQSGGIGFGSSIFGPGLSPFQQEEPFFNTTAGPVDIENASQDPLCQCLLEGVTSPLFSSFANNVSLSPGATLCASYTDGLPFLAINAAGNIVGLNTFPADANDNLQASYQQLVANTVFCVACTSCPCNRTTATGSAVTITPTDCLEPGDYHFAICNTLAPCCTTCTDSFMVSPCQGFECPITVEFPVFNITGTVNFYISRDVTGECGTASALCAEVQSVPIDLSCTLCPDADCDALAAAFDLDPCAFLKFTLTPGTTPDEVIPTVSIDCAAISSMV
ncbi:hypothetical protein [Bacillus mycoides]|uniref:hypothetical protein n=1 Tax=Bacillus mycoides TaxID=1405 RepID=UPI00273BBB8F|nr:hypothetical protein [Bacillus mycoides]